MPTQQKTDNLKQAIARMGKTLGFIGAGQMAEALAREFAAALHASKPHSA